MSGLALALGIGSPRPGDLSGRRLQTLAARRGAGASRPACAQFVRAMAKLANSLTPPRPSAGRQSHADDGELSCCGRVLDDHLGAPTGSREKAIAVDR